MSGVSNSKNKEWLVYRNAFCFRSLTVSDTWLYPAYFDIKKLERKKNYV